jgi:hypothetical protein
MIVNFDGSEKTRTGESLIPAPETAGGNPYPECPHPPRKRYFIGLEKKGKPEIRDGVEDNSVMRKIFPN